MVTAVVAFVRDLLLTIDSAPSLSGTNMGHLFLSIGVGKAGFERCFFFAERNPFLSGAARLDPFLPELILFKSLVQAEAPFPFRSI
jgi:hypothetical protein